MCFSFSDQVNKKTLADIQESIFVLNLDEAMPATVGVDERYCTMAGQMLHGGGSQHNTSNRWFDKTLQVIDKLFVFMYIFIIFCKKC